MQIHKPVTQYELEFPDNGTLMSTTDTQSYIAYANEAFVEAGVGLAEAVKVFQ